MLAPAHAGHLGLLQNWIKSGAAEGSFDRELMRDSAESTLFFANLRQALVVGYFVQEDARGRLMTCSASGYMYCPDRTGDRSHPIGFGLFKALANFGYELWLTGVDRAWRGHGHGRAMCCPPCSRRRRASALSSCGWIPAAPAVRRCSICSNRWTSPRSAIPRPCAGSCAGMPRRTSRRESVWRRWCNLPHTRAGPSRASAAVQGLGATVCKPIACASPQRANLPSVIPRDDACSSPPISDT
jgi:hypothetical protein